MLKVNMRTGETEQCSLLDLMEGGVKELADRDLQRVLENLKDVNTDPKKARSISVKFTLTGDDGTTQTVTAKTGILTASQVAVPNPVQLAPLCTFSDAEQPMRRFVFRLKGGEDGVSAALFEADGNAWKNAAIRNIKAYFEREIPQELRDDVIILA